MPNSDSKTYILDDQWTDKDALDFTPYVETLAYISEWQNIIDHRRSRHLRFQQHFGGEI